MLIFKGVESKTSKTIVSLNNFIVAVITAWWFGYYMACIAN